MASSLSHETPSPIRLAVLAIQHVLGFDLVAGLSMCLVMVVVMINTGTPAA